MDGVQRSHIYGQKSTGGGQYPIVDSSQIHSSEHILSTPDRLGAEVQKGARYLGPCKRARNERPPTA